MARDESHVNDVGVDELSNYNHPFRTFIRGLIPGEARTTRGLLVAVFLPGQPTPTRTSEHS